MSQLSFDNCPSCMPRAVACGSVDGPVPNAAEVKHLPYSIYLWTVIALCFAGLTLSAYLSVAHFRVHTDIVYQSFCAISKAINCDTVSQSEYSVAFGLPVSVWGVFGYIFFLMIAAVAIATPCSPRGWDLLLLTSLFFSLTSMVFAGISAFKIGSYCLICIFTYAVNWLLLFFTWITRRRFPSGGLRSGLWLDGRFLWSKRSICVPAFIGFALVLAATWYMVPPYWKFRPPQANTRVPSGVTEAGHAWIGAEQPVLEITEFTDYQCFQCRKMHLYLRELVAHYPEKIRLVHRNYPMDHEFNPIVKEPFHSGSGRMALLAIHGAAAGKFWELNDHLFEMVGGADRINLMDIEAETGIEQRLLSAALANEPYRIHLLSDIREGMKLGIVGTPSYLIEGKVYEGGIPPEVLQSVIGGTDK